MEGRVLVSLDFTLSSTKEYNQRLHQYQYNIRTLNKETTVSTIHLALQ
jgi:hypothetical protein